jgi:hypothetical protein
MAKVEVKESGHHVKRHGLCVAVLADHSKSASEVYIEYEHYLGMVAVLPFCRSF